MCALLSVTFVNDKKMDSDKTMFKKRTETTDAGRLYEDLLTGVIGIKLTMDSKKNEFNISSNHPYFGKFDDIVVETVDHNLAYQLKYQKNTKNIQNVQLLDTKGDFSIIKYFEDYKILIKKDKKFEDFKYILFTNKKYYFNPKAVIIENEKSDIKLRCKLVECIDDLIPYSNDGQIFQFEDKSQIEIENFKHFLQNFYLYTKQKNVTNLRNDIADLFRKQLGCIKDSDQRYVTFIQDWSRRETSKYKLTRDIIQLKIVECLLHPFIKPCLFQKNNTSKMNLLQDAFGKCDITLIEEVPLETFKRETKYIKLKDKITNILDKYELPLMPLDPIVQAKLLWYSDKRPLIIEVLDPSCKKSVMEAINLCQREVDTRRIILISSHFKSQDFSSDITMFENINDLSKENKMYEEILKTFNVFFEGREVFLKDMIGISKIKVKTLLEMVDGPFKIGGSLKELPQPYVQRHFSGAHLNVKDMKLENDLLLISCKDNLDFVTTNIQETVDLDQYLQWNTHELHHDINNLVKTYKPNILDDKQKKCSILTTNRCITHLDFNEICQKIQISNVHLIELTATKEFQWICSYGKIDTLLKHRIEPSVNKIRESDMFKHFQGPVNIIAADPGMGKSIAANFLKNKCPSDLWPLKIECKAIFQKLQPEDINQVFKDVLNDASKQYQNFSKEVFNEYKATNRILIIWDGIDELLDDVKIDIAIQLIQSLKRKGFVQWVTTRKHLQPKLESTLNVFAIYMVPFDENEQRDYIRERIKDCPDITVNNIMKTIRITNFSEGLGLGIPLQIYMMTEIFQKSNKITDKRIYLTDMYDMFIEGKFKTYKDKTNMDNSLGNTLLNDQKKLNLKRFKNLAFHKNFNLSFDKLLPEDKEYLETFESDIYGVIIKLGSDKLPIFTHNTYGEFLCAKYLQEKKNDVDIKKYLLLLFDQKYDTLRYMFDMLLAKGFDTHLAILTEDMELFKKQVLLPVSEDQGGRTPLHLISSWGRRHLPIEMIWQELPIDISATAIIMCKENRNIHKEMLKVIVTTYTSNPENIYLFSTKDVLLEFDIFQYADKSFSLYAFEQLLNNIF